jgi:hypothetical protein
LEIFTMNDEQLSHRDSLGRFTTGNPGSPGRAPKARELAVLDAVKAEFSPEEIAAKLRTALELAEELRSPRAMTTVLETILAYTVGKPTQAAPPPPGGVSILEMIMRHSVQLLPLREGEVLPGPSRHLLEADDG